MDTDYNRGHCYCCGTEVDEDSWDEVAPGQRVWVCGESRCRAEVQGAQQDSYEQARDDARNEAERDFERNYWDR